MDERSLVPLYTQGEASRILGLPQSTFNHWASGYKTLSGNRMPPFITVERPGRGFTVPFIGLAEAWIVRAFTKAGVPVVRIRPALEQLRTQIGVEHALASDRLKTDGAEILWDLRQKNAAFDDNRLVVVRNGQAAFGEIVREHLKLVEYRDGFIGQVRIPRASGAGWTIDPHINFGQPTLSEYGVRVDDVLDRLAAGETIQDVAHDYDIPAATVENLVLAAA
ncbi:MULTISPECIES: DUF433 domain-containing protein [unclassified Leifsonia]|uniref:DUF433 domain-containing protein n=1 Tax=unclassified Leifsonia TaxID=2663824 RepID=UPI0003658E7A|nr:MULTISPECIES: DUF433 domain-containing protein [unclassified Leifsonia]TDQ02459.1 uncharacterized protein DUF433 [Leifsonia sp. 115AMFTsu3.1]